MRAAAGSVLTRVICFFFFFFFFLNLVVLFFFFFVSNQPFIGIDSETFFILELFKEAWECGYNNNNNIEENCKEYQRVFDIDSSALCPH